MHSKHRMYYLLVSALLYVLTRWCIVPAPGASPLTIFHNARVFDGLRVLEHADVVVSGGRILSVGTTASAPAGAVVISCAGKTLLPGLIDSHTHVGHPTALEHAIIFGVTTELDMFSDPGQFEEIKEAARTASRPRADLLSAGLLATAPGGHGTQFGTNLPTLSEPSQADAFVESRLHEGSDYIKIVYGRGSSNRPKMSVETMRALVSAAQARGKMTVVHVQTLDEAADAIRAGASGLAHIPSDKLPDESWVRSLGSHKAFVIPTLTVLESAYRLPSGAALVNTPSIGPYLTTRQVQTLTTPFSKLATDSDFEVPRRAVLLFRKAGFRILAGTDCPNPGTAHGASIHRELELLVDAGLSPMEALVAATSAPAETFRLNDRGRILSGRLADLLLVEGDPTKSITATRNIAGIWKGGREVNREEYRMQLLRSGPQK